MPIYLVLLEVQRLSEARDKNLDLIYVRDSVASNKKLTDSQPQDSHGFVGIDIKSVLDRTSNVYETHHWEFSGTVKEFPQDDKKKSDMSLWSPNDLDSILNGLEKKEICLVKTLTKPSGAFGDRI